jgi:hypothetical protein
MKDSWVNPTLNEEHNNQTWPYSQPIPRPHVPNPGQPTNPTRLSQTVITNFLNQLSHQLTALSAPPQ